MIRRADIEDVEHLSKLHHACFPRGWSEGEFGPFLSRSDIYCCFVSTSDHKKEIAIDGFILVSSAGGEAEIVTLCTAPAVRRRGTGRSLLREATAYLQEQNVSKMFLEVSKTNGPAIKLYKSCGFEIAGERAGYVRQADGSTTDALLMEYTF